MTDWNAFAGEIGGAGLIDAPGEVARKSRDFYWYSPVLKAKLDDRRAERVVVPRCEDDVIRIARACVRRRIPVTVRGGGTGNYGQAVPLAGGVVLDMTAMNRIRRHDGPVARFEAGAIMKDLDDALAPAGWELRIHPSTAASASIGGFVAGGAAGCGSINFGRLRERGNILGLRLVTMEDEPQAIELQGDDVQQVHQAWGTNGIVTELEMPLAPAYRWVQTAIAFEAFDRAGRFCQRLAESDGIVKKSAALFAWPIPGYFRRFRGRLPDGAHVVFAMIAEPSLPAAQAVVREHGGEIVLNGLLGGDGIDGPPLYEYTWNHTTLYAMRADPSFTYIQSLFPAGRNLETMARMRETFGDEVLMHAEFVRIDGRITNSALQLVRFTGEARLNEIMDLHAAAGIGVANPHIHHLDDSYKRVSLAAQLALKRRADPHGLLNPGKLRQAAPADEAAE